MSKKTYEIIIELDDYGNESYNANILFPNKYIKSETFEKLNMLYAIAEIINSEIDIQENYL